MKNFKKGLAFVLAVIMLFTSLAVSVSAEDYRNMEAGAAESTTAKADDCSAEGTITAIDGTVITGKISAKNHFVEKVKEFFNWLRGCCVSFAAVVLEPIRFVLEFFFGIELDYDLIVRHPVAAVNA